MTRALYTLQYAKCMPKGTSLDETTSNSEKIKPIALAVIELHLPEGIRQASGRQAGGRTGRQAGRQGRAGRQIVSRKFHLIFFFNFVSIYWNPLGSY